MADYSLGNDYSYSSPDDWGDEGDSPRPNSAVDNLRGLGTKRMVATGALAGLQVWNGIQQAQMIQDQAATTAKIADMNARFTDYDAYKAGVDGETKVARYQTRIDENVAQQREGYASENVDVNYGTAAQMQSESRLTGYLNQLDMQTQARQKALGLTQQARNIRLDSAIKQNQANVESQAAFGSGVLSAGSTFLTGYTRGGYGAGSNSDS